MSDPAPTTLAIRTDLTQAKLAVLLAVVDPLRSYGIADSLRATADPEVAVTALRALGLAGKELGRLREGLAHLDAALRIAERAGLSYAAAQVRMNQIGLLTARGDPAAARTAFEAAAPVLRGSDADMLLANQACALARRGLMTEAVRTAERALPGLRARGDAVPLAGLLTNSGLARAYLGRLAQAEAELREALTVAGRAGLRHLAAMALGGLAFAAFRRGDLPQALALYEQIEPELIGADERLAQLRLDRAEALIAARLTHDARAVIARAVNTTAARGYRADTADGLLLLAHAELADGDPTRAAGTAQRARQKLAAQGRGGWALLAEHLWVRARWAAGDRSAALLGTAYDTAQRLEQGHWAAVAADTRVVAGLLALERGSPALARRLLAGVSAARRHGPVEFRVAAWQATALDRESRDDRRGAAAAVRAGLRVVEEFAAALGAVDLRAHAAGWGTELAEIGLRIAFTGRPRSLLAAAERGRASTGRPLSIRPPRDQRLAADLAELRRLSACRAEAAARGDAAPRLRAEQVRLEHAVRSRTRGPAGDAGPAARAEPGRGPQGMVAELTELADALGERAFVELIRIDDGLLAVSLVDGRCRSWDLGSYRQAAHETRIAQFAVRRLTHGRDTSAADGLTRAAGRLQAQIIDPLRRALGDRHVVLAPTGILHTLAWSAVPAFSGRPLTVVPSGLAWLRAARTVPRGRGVVLVAGPGLAGAAVEVAALGACYPKAFVLTGENARAEPVRAALDGAALAHLAAHGVFRPGNALFSSLCLTDGPLMAYDLVELPCPPHTVVLSACDAGQADVDSGETVMGIVSALLTVGTATVIASVTPVRDAAAGDFMMTLHQHMIQGLRPAQALAATRRDPGVLGFLCFGAG